MTELVRKTASADTGGELDIDNPQVIKGIKTFEDDVAFNGAVVGVTSSKHKLQSLTGAQDVDEWLKPITPLHLANEYTNTAVLAYAHGVAADSGAYQGGVYSPTQNRIYLVPNVQAVEANWHYIDCNSGDVVAYAHGAAALVSGAYSGGVYSPTQNRIYLVPGTQAESINWHYIDCDNGNVIAYAHEAASATISAYLGGVYSPTQDRIYLIPYGQKDLNTWHYIDCSDGSVVAYTHGATVGGQYFGGVYSPTQDRIYFVPFYQADENNWHYIQHTGYSDEIAPHMFGSTILSSTL